MQKAYELSEKILERINTYSEKYTTENATTVRSEDSINLLNEIIENGLSLYKYLVDKKYYEKKPGITAALLELGKYIDKLQINEKNSKKLKLSNALQIWDQTKLAIAVLACEVLDYRDSLN